MNIFIISHLYAPSISPRALRWSAIAEQWAKQGHTVDVLSGWSPGLPREECLNGVRVYRVGGIISEVLRGILSSSSNRLIVSKNRVLKPKIVNSKVVLAQNLPSFTKLLHDFSWKKIYWPDYACIWYFSAVKKVGRLLKQKKYNVAISVSLPFTDHVVGLWLTKHFKNVPWLADVGDPFCFNDMKHLNNHVLYRKLNYKTERYVFRKADWITVTTEATASIYKRIFPETAQKIHVIPPLLTEAAKTDGVMRGVFDKDKINISYIGNFYKSIREPDNLLSLVTQLLHGSPRLKKKLRLHIFGNAHLFIDDFEGCKDLSQLCLLYGSVPRGVVNQIINESDMLINLGNTTHYQLPSKIVEYAASGKPIINICTSENDSSLRFLNDYPLMINIIMKTGKPPNSVRKLAKFIEKHYDKRLNDKKLQKFLRPYQIEHVSYQYYSILLSMKR